MYKVLIVDDEPKVSELIKNLIDWNGLGLLHVATAQDGYSALELIKQHNPEIIITDIRMPGYSGIDLIKNAKEFNPTIDFIVVSGYQHFDYAYNAIKYGVKDYLLKPLKKDEINATLTKMVNKYSCQSKQEENRQEDIKRLRQEFMECIYNASDRVSIEGKPLEQINQYYNLGFTEGYYQALIIKPDFDYQPDNKETMKILLDKILNIATSNLYTVCAEVLSAALQNRIFMILNYKEENRKLIRRTLNTIIDESHLFRDVIENLTVSIGLGGTDLSLDAIQQSTMQAKIAINDRIVTGGGRINPYNQQLHTMKPADSIITFDKRKRLVDLIEILDVEGAEKWINAIKAETLEKSCISGQFVLETVDEIMEIILYSLKNHARVNTVEKSVFNECKEALDMQNNVRSVFEVLGLYIRKILFKIEDNRKNETIRPIKEAQKYISEHFASDISLERISSIVGFNSAYFSTLFKKETGIGFLEYLTAVRIKTAKQLLADTRKSIPDICYEVGYSDLKHFTRQFKKLTSLTPSEYRKFYY